MKKNHLILITGLLGLFASITVGLGEFLLHYSDKLVGNSENYNFFYFVPERNLTWGHFLTVVGTPFYFVGYYHIYKMLKGKENKWAFAVFALGIIAFTVGGFWITSRAFLGTIVHLQEEIDTGIYTQILDNYTLFSESLVQVLRIVIFLLSVFFIISILKFKTYYDKLMVLANPILLLILVFAVYFITPGVGKYIAPIAMNVVHFILFSLSLYQFNKNYK
ncbi:hypothetical protein KO500_06520 [Cellulophaga baltica]|uniref:DUF6796 family protein n=1 Tax=Cellulophaga TaxID=104264 RepID=UPI001C071017|nr:MULTISPECIES: DUF6796 family protein [Cellulophaga]MBU2996078.1 hypothetical protein [Cellulophaga baltica]MDO6767473.1 hypothetical protein [Cellulophaga sp. 1_MG-2023]